jgi:capsular polysaccharide biosynthesis protein
MKIYRIEEAGKGFIGHWFWFMLGALKNIPEFGKEKIQLCFLDDRYPQYVLETFELLNDKIELVPYTDSSIYIESVRPYDSNSNGLDIPFVDPSVYLFLREMFFPVVNNLNDSEYDRIYIRRNLSHFSIGNAYDIACKNIRRRQIVNEDELVKRLIELDFKILSLEDFHIRDKIRIFHNASVILGPNGGGMVYTFASQPRTKYIEILPPNPHQYIDQYRHVCRALDLQFYRFQDVIKEDHLDNMTVNIDSLISYLRGIL